MQFHPTNFYKSLLELKSRVDKILEIDNKDDKTYSASWNNLRSYDTIFDSILEICMNVDNTAQTIPNIEVIKKNNDNSEIIEKLKEIRTNLNIITNSYYSAWNNTRFRDGKLYEIENPPDDIKILEDDIKEFIKKVTDFRNDSIKPYILQINELLNPEDENNHKYLKYKTKYLNLKKILSKSL
jgi:hypothetical protein